MLNDLFEYNHYCNTRLAERLASANTPQPALELFSHILNAHHIWNSRLKQETALYKVFDVHDVLSFPAIEEANNNNTLWLLGNKDPKEQVTYRNTKGDQFVNAVKDILFHVINHSTYHRAQIATHLRNAGIDPVPTDFIFYKR